MSGKNKVNPDHYKVAGRLSQDDLARERRRQSDQFGATRGRQDKPLPPWMLNEQVGRPEEGEAEESANNERQARTPAATQRAAKPATKPQPRPRAKAAESKAKAKTKTKTKTKTQAKARPKPAQAAKRASKSARRAPTARKAAKSRKAPTSAAKKSPRATAKKAPRSAAKRPARSARTSAKKKSR